MPARELDLAIRAAAMALEPLARLLVEACPGPACPEDRMALTFRPGERVWDKVTQQEGQIIAGTRREILIPPPGR